MAYKLKRWAKLNKVFIVGIIAIALFGLMDAMNIEAVYNIKDEAKWTIYEQFSAPAIIGLWFAVLAIIAIVWYIAYKDKSEAIALFAASSIMLLSGLEDLFFFIFKPGTMTQCLDWFEGSAQSFVSKYILHETCVSPLGLTLNVILGITIAFYVFKYFKTRKW